MVTEHTVTLKEHEILGALTCEIAVLCVIKWECCGSRRLRDSIKKITDDGTQIAKYHKVINMAVGATFTLPLGGSHTPRTCLLRSVSVVLYRSPDKDWDVEKEMKGWRLKWLGRRHFWCMKVERELRKMAHPWFTVRPFRMALYCHPFTQVDMSTETPCSTILSSEENHSAAKVTVLSIRLL